jgi:hypothetical protein
VISRSILTSYPHHLFQLFEECYRLLVKLHKSHFIENIDRLLDKSVRGFERASRGNTISKHQKSVSVDPKIDGRKEATDSVHDTDCMTSEVRTLPDVNKHKSPSVKEQCKYFDPQITGKNFRHVVKRGDKCSTLKRQEYVQGGMKKAVDITSKCRSSQFIRKKCAIFEGGEPHNLCRKQNCYTNSSHSASQFTNNISNTTVTEGRRRSLPKYETVNRSLGNNGSGSEKHIACFKDKLNISVNNNTKPSPIICSSTNSDDSSSSSSSRSSSNNSNNNQNNKPPESTPPVITDLCHFSLSNSPRNSTNSGIESLHESGKVESSNKLQSSTVQDQTIPSSVLQNNHCQKVLEQCDTETQVGSRLTTPTSTVSLPSKVEYKTIKTHSLGDNQDADGLQTESASCIYKVTVEVQCSPPNEEEEPSEHGSSLSNQHCNSGSPSGDSLSSVTKEISFTEELSIDVSNIEQSPENEQQTSVSSCEPHCTSTVHLPSKEGSAETDELRNDYKPMNASFRRNCYQFKPVTPSELLNKDASGADNCGNEYEEIVIRYTSDIHPGKSNSNVLSAYEVPLYQLYDFERVSWEYFSYKTCHIMNRLFLPCIAYETNLCSVQCAVISAFFI